MTSLLGRRGGTGGVSYSTLIFFVKKNNISYPQSLLLTTNHNGIIIKIIRVEQVTKSKHDNTRIKECS